VRIDLHHHLLHNRRDFVEAKDTKFTERIVFRLFRAAMLRPWLYALGGQVTRLGLRALYGAGLAGSRLDPMRAWNRQRTPPPLPKKSFRAHWKEERKG
jgi:hypothetical protein